MGRKPSSALPSHMRAMRKASGRTYYYFDRGIQRDGSRPFVPLGADYREALRKYAELALSDMAPAVTFGEAVRRFQVEELYKKAPATQKDILWSIPHLMAFFDNPPAPFDAIKTKHIQQYITHRSKDAPTRANREISWFSAVWNWSRREGITDAPNPCQGAKKNREAGRKVYVHDADLEAIRRHADGPLRNALDLAYLTGQRPADVLRMSETSIRDGALELRQGKTDAPLRIAITGELAALVERMTQAKQAHSVRSLSLLINEKGQALTKSMLRRRFEKAREDAALAAQTDEDAARMRGIQFRDLRAKAGTDKANASGDIRKAQKQLGHSTVSTTQRYMRDRIGELVEPTK